MNAGRTFRAVVLAGNRTQDDAVALSEGVAHKSLATVQGRPILERVLNTLEASPHIRDITLITDQYSPLATIDFIAARLKSASLALHPARSSPAKSLLSLLSLQSKADYPFIVVSSDAAMLDQPILEAFCSRANQSLNDLSIGFARETDISATFPATKRTYLRFSDGGYSGCNLFALSTPQAQNAISFWVRAEHYRKKPLRLASIFGPRLLLSLAARRWPISTALDKIGHRLGLSAEPIILPHAHAAIDVDSLDDLAAVRNLWAAREAKDTRPQ